MCWVGAARSRPKWRRLRRLGGGGSDRGRVVVEPDALAEQDPCNVEVDLVDQSHVEAEDTPVIVPARLGSASTFGKRPITATLVVERLLFEISKDVRIVAENELRVSAVNDGLDGAVAPPPCGMVPQEPSEGLWALVVLA